MDKQASQPRLFTFLIVVTAAALSSLCTFLIVTQYTRPTCEPVETIFTDITKPVLTPAGLPNNARDIVEKFKANGVTALRAHGVNKCFIMTGEQDLEHASNRVLTVLGTSMNREQIDAIYGERIGEFCGARDGYAVQLDQIVRAKRQAAAAGVVNAAPLAQNPNANSDRLPNACQNTQVIQCTEDGQPDPTVTQVQYKCNTGANEVFRANVQCDKNNTFHFTLTRRCGLYQKTENERWIKCYADFINGRTGEQIKNDD